MNACVIKFLLFKQNVELEAEWALAASKIQSLRFNLLSMSRVRSPSKPFSPKSVKFSNQTDSKVETFLEFG